MSILNRKNLMIFFFSSAISLLSAEVVLRHVGYQPWKVNTIYTNSPSIHEEHPVMGWRLKEGSFLSPPYHPSGPDILYTFLENGMRKSHKSQTNISDDRPKLILVGGSYTLGWAISDDETYSWKLQERFPFVEVLNYSAGGYGTYQSLLSLEEVLPSMQNPEIVIYGFIENHEERNVASASWMEGLSITSKEDIYMPFVTINNDGQLFRHQPEQYPSWPLRGKSTLVSLSQKAFMKIKAMGREKEKKQVTEQLLIEMRKMCEQYEIEFFVAILDSTERTKKHYIKFLENNDIMATDCAYPLTKEMRVKGEGHPNGMQNSKWAACIANALSKQNLIKTKGSSRKRW